MKNPDPSIYRFYCPTNKCWCSSDEICKRRMGLLKRSHAVPGNPILFKPSRILEFYPNLEACLNCPQGKRIMEKLNKKKCCWPGCSLQEKGYGLCAKHLKQAKEDGLFNINTKADLETTSRAVRILADISKKTDRNINEIAFRAIITGLNQYLKQENPRATWNL